jgi:hypothetical protein
VGMLISGDESSRLSMYVIQVEWLCIYICKHVSSSLALNLVLNITRKSAAKSVPWPAGPGATSSRKTTTCICTFVSVPILDWSAFGDQHRRQNSRSRCVNGD